MIYLSILALIVFLLTFLLIKKGKQDFIFLLCLLVFFLPFERLPSLEISGATFKINHYLGLITIMIWIVRKMYKQKFSSNPLIVPTIILISSIVVSVSQSVLVSRSLLFSLLVGFVVMLMIVVADELKTFAQWKRIKHYLFITTGLVVVFSFWQFFGDIVGVPLWLTGLDEGYSKIVFGFPRVHAFSKEPLYLGNFLLLPLGILLAEGMIKGWQRKYVVGTLAILLIFLLTLSRGALIGLFAFVVVWLLFKAKDVLKPHIISANMIIATVIFAIAIIIVGISGQGKQQAFINQLTIKDLGRSESTVSRLDAGRDAIELGMANPYFGVGLGNFGGARVDFNDRNKDKFDDIVNNEFLELWAELGIFGLGSYLIFLSMLISRSILVIRKKTMMNEYIIGLTAAIIGMMVQYNFFSTLSIIHIWVSFGLLIALQNIGIKEYEQK